MQVSFFDSVEAGQPRTMHNFRVVLVIIHSCGISFVECRAKACEIVLSTPSDSDTFFGTLTGASLNILLNSDFVRPTC